MGCYGPIRGWRSQEVNEKTGKRPIVFKRNEGFEDQVVMIPCGKCDGCVIDKTREWATRAVLESQMHIENSFLTLTYNKESLPMDGSIHKSEVSGFIKALRQQNSRLAEKVSLKADEIRFFGCGEYGDKMGRPHYHVLVFGYRPDDLEFFKIGVNDEPIYTSDKLERLWGKGFCTVGEVTGASAAYVARYLFKKRDGIKDPKRYVLSTDCEVLEMPELTKEFALMSRGQKSEYDENGVRIPPGIGGRWVHKFLNDIRKDYLMMDGHKVPLPRYFKDYLSEYDHKVAKRNDRARKRKRDELEAKGEYDSRRLDQKEIVKKAQIAMLRRGGENA